jgi:hypothetical protein
MTKRSLSPVDALLQQEFHVLEAKRAKLTDITPECSSLASAAPDAPKPIKMHDVVASWSDTFAHRCDASWKQAPPA